MLKFPRHEEIVNDQEDQYGPFDAAFTCIVDAFLKKLKVSQQRSEGLQCAKYKLPNVTTRIWLKEGTPFWVLLDNPNDAQSTTMEYVRSPRGLMYSNVGLYECDGGVGVVSGSLERLNEPAIIILDGILDQSGGQLGFHKDPVEKYRELFPEPLKERVAGWIRDHNPLA